MGSTPTPRYPLSGPSRGTSRLTLPRRRSRQWCLLGVREMREKVRERERNGIGLSKLTRRFSDLDPDLNLFFPSLPPRSPLLSPCPPHTPRASRHHTKKHSQESTRTASSASTATPTSCPPKSSRHCWARGCAAARSTAARSWRVRGALWPSMPRGGCWPGAGTRGALSGTGRGPPPRRGPTPRRRPRRRRPLPRRTGSPAGSRLCSGPGSCRRRPGGGTAWRWTRRGARGLGCVSVFFF